MAPPLAPFWGPRSGPHFGSVCLFSVEGGVQKTDPIFALFMSPEATAVWQWFHFLQGQVPADRPVLRLNLDETSVRFWYQPCKGMRRPRCQVPRAGFARKASRAQLRKAFSHIAIISDDTSLQPYLPQMLLVNERTVSAELERRWTSLPGCNAKLWRGKSAWINDKLFAKIIRELGKVLRARAGGRQAILLLDAHRSHFSKCMLAACRDYDIWPVVIPARMTSLLQPLDTHVFSRFKMFLRTRLHQIMMTGANEDLTSEQVIDALLHAIKGVLQRHPWAPAFAQNGFGPTFEVRPHLLEALAWHTPPTIDLELPAYDQFAHCFPRRCDIPFMQLLSGVLPRAPGAPKRRRVEAAEDGSESAEVRTWNVRLRPRLFGRAVVAKAKPMPAPMPAMAPASSTERPAPSVPMMTLGGQLLPSLKRLPSMRRGPSTDLL